MKFFSSQGTISKVYPAQLSLNALICFIASLQSSLLALFFARNPLLWRLEWNVQLLTIIYCVSTLVHIWFTTEMNLITLHLIFFSIEENNRLEQNILEPRHIFLHGCANSVSICYRELWSQLYATTYKHGVSAARDFT